MPKRKPAANPGPTLSKAALDLRAKLLAEFDISDVHGLALLQSALESFDGMRAAQAVVSKHGPCIVDRWGQLRTNPAAAIARDCRAQYLKALRDLNLDAETPAKVGRPFTLPESRR